MVLSTDRNLLKSFAAPFKRSLAAAALKLCAVSGGEAALETSPKATKSGRAGRQHRLDRSQQIAETYRLSEIGIAPLFRPLFSSPGIA